MTDSSDVLNIGAGRNRSGALRAVRRRGPHIVGVDPHESIWLNGDVDKRFQATLQEFAHEHRAEFDVAFSVYVMEHVSDPETFSDACATVLRPGGVLFGLTVHKYQYFGLTTWATTRLGLTDRILNKLKDPEAVAKYHFPTEYRMNSPRQVAGFLRRAGFRTVEFRMFDKPELYASYLPQRLRSFPPAWTRAAYALNAPWMMGHLGFRAVK